MRTPYENETRQQYTQPYLSAYQSARTAYFAHQEKLDTPAYSREHERELAKALKTALDNLKAAQKTYKEWEAAKATKKRASAPIVIQQNKTTSSTQASAGTSRPKTSIETLVKNARKYNDYIDKSKTTYGESERQYKNGTVSSQKVPTPPATTAQKSSEQKTAVEKAVEQAKEKKPSRAPIIKFTGAGGQVLNSISIIKSAGDLLDAEGNISLNNAAGKNQSAISKTAEVQEALQRSNALWNKKIDSSKKQLWANLKKQGWDVPEDEAGRKALYEKVKEMSPDLFYHGAYVGTDQKALASAKNLYNNVGVASIATTALGGSKLTEAQKQIAAQFLVDHDLKMVAQNLVDQKFQEVVDKRVLDVLAKFGYDKNAQGCIQAIKDVVRGSMYAKIKSRDDLQQIVTETASQLKTMIDTKTDEVISKYGDKAMGKIEPALAKMNGEIDKSFTKIDDAAKKADEAMARLETKMAMVGDISNMVGGKLDGFNTKLNSSLAKYGIEMDFSPMYKDALNGWGKDINNKLAVAKVGQKITDTKNQVAQVATQVQKYKDMVKSYVNGVKALVTKWVNVIKDKVKEMTSKLLNNLVKSVNVGGASIKLNF